VVPRVNTTSAALGAEGRPAASDRIVMATIGKTKREIQELLAERAPKPDVLPTITALPTPSPSPSPSPSPARQRRSNDAALDVARRALANLGFHARDIHQALMRVLPPDATGPAPAMPELLRATIGLLTT